MDSLRNTFQHLGNALHIDLNLFYRTHTILIRFHAPTYNCLKIRTQSLLVFPKNLSRATHSRSLLFSKHYCFKKVTEKTIINKSKITFGWYCKCAREVKRNVCIFYVTARKFEQLKPMFDTSINTRCVPKQYPPCICVGLITMTHGRASLMTRGDNCPPSKILGWQ